MLRTLSIRDFVIVDSLELEFHPGFTVLTGETGAGKSILIDALALTLGGRGDAAVVRAACERADISAEFDIQSLPELALWLRASALEGDPGTILLRRIIDKNGRSRAFVNGRPATLGQLREAGEWLVDIHGQHAHQSLLKADAQRVLLDAHAGLAPLAAEVAEAYRQWQKLGRARAEYETHAAQRNAECEQLQWQARELEQLALLPEEWEAVQSEHTRLAHAAGLIEGVRAALETLSEADAACLPLLAGAGTRLEALLGYDARLREASELLRSGEAQVQEAVYALRHYADRVELDPQRLAAVEARMEAIHGSARKFRLAPKELPGHLRQLQARLAELEVASNLETLVIQEQQARTRYFELAGRLGTGRKKAAAKLGKEVTQAMQRLAMPDGRFEVALNPCPPDGSLHGSEQIEFLVAANPGVEARALAKVASGGELSRISLAIQVITSKAALVPTMIFDEVDAGIGGGVAEIVGRQLKSLGQERQVLCVTHLPQVAAQADGQWSVSKFGIEGKVKTLVSVLDRKGRIEEVARMLGGTEITATTRKHAAEMLSLR
ncbi:MAG: DNA repair protein RecN [Betaproteobacteria bacterium]|nr:MAG: DNA repair protein RecN [Betaproteobacteria bacterium]